MPTLNSNLHMEMCLGGFTISFFRLICILPVLHNDGRNLPICGQQLLDILVVKSTATHETLSCSGMDGSQCICQVFWCE